MSQMKISMIPGCSDIPDTLFYSGKIAWEDIFIKICETGKFSVVRWETIFMGYYRSGATVGQPVSPVDGYQYSPQEVRYDFSVFTTRGAGPNFINGQALVPTFALGQISNNQPANLYWPAMDIDDITGQVTNTVSYFAQGRVPETITGDGILKVDAICQRQSLNTLVMFISSSAPPSPVVSVAYSFGPTVSGGMPVYSWSIGGTLPTGISINALTGVISGTTTQTGSFPLTLFVRDATGLLAQQSFTWTI